MSQPVTEANAITTQPSINYSNNKEPKLDEIEANVITNQPLLNDPNNEEQEKKKFSQFNPSTTKPPEKRNQQEGNEDVAESCIWCCFTCADCAQGCDCTGCCDDNVDCCTGCCDDNEDCCTGCCEDVPSADNIDGDDVAGCLECCGSCFEICNGCCSD